MPTPRLLASILGSQSDQNVEEGEGMMTTMTKVRRDRGREREREREREEGGESEILILFVASDDRFKKTNLF